MRPPPTRNAVLMQKVIEICAYRSAIVDQPRNRFGDHLRAHDAVVRCIWHKLEFCFDSARR